MRFSSVFALAVFATAIHPANAAVVLTNTVYTQDFDSLANTGFSSTLPTGWSFVETDTNANETYRAGTGSNNAGDTYSFGAADSTERALGSLTSNMLVSAYGVQITNDLDNRITELGISYFGELWRQGRSGNSDTLSFAYSLDATSLTTGTYIPFTALDFSITPLGTDNQAVDGNANRTAIDAVITGLNLAPGESIFLRWSDANIPFNDHGLAIDDFELSAVAVPEPSTWLMLIAGFGLVGAAARRRRVGVVLQ